ncbi:hypothetical protein GY45DRAFT_114307 [Cubamyces sp. BRFM 1775]|nr:hypothetical protein GY45DRAFT_114307 [Cubamyces sp. BRFM 1775]
MSACADSRARETTIEAVRTAPRLELGWDPTATIRAIPVRLGLGHDLLTNAVPRHLVRVSTAARMNLIDSPGFSDLQRVGCERLAQTRHGARGRPRGASSSRSTAARASDSTYVYSATARIRSVADGVALLGAASALLCAVETALREERMLPRGGGGEEEGGRSLEAHERLTRGRRK